MGGFGVYLKHPKFILVIARILRQPTKSRFLGSSGRVFSGRLTNVDGIRALGLLGLISTSFVAKRLLRVEGLGFRVRLSDLESARWIACWLAQLHAPIALRPKPEAIHIEP